jgi:hypothetical protein
MEREKKKELWGVGLHVNKTQVCTVVVQVFLGGEVKETILRDCQRIEKMGAL